MHALPNAIVDYYATLSMKMLRIGLEYTNLSKHLFFFFGFWDRRANF